MDNNFMVGYVKDLLEEVNLRMDSFDRSIKKDEFGNPVPCESLARWNCLFYALCDCRDTLKDVLRKNEEVLER